MDLKFLIPDAETTEAWIFPAGAGGGTESGIKPGAVALAAQDSQKSLSASPTTGPSTRTAASFQPILIPIKNVAELIRMLEEETEDIRVFVGKGQLSLEGSGLLATTRLVDGSFPDYRQIMPKEFKTEAVMLKEDLLASLKLTTLFSDRFNQLHINADPKKKLFELSAKSGEFGESVSALPAAQTGEAFKGNFNHRYISDCLSAVSADSVAFRFSGDNRPLLVGGVGDPSFRYLVMPMNR